VFAGTILLGALLSIAASAVAQNPAVTTDPAPDKANPAGVVTFLMPSHGAQLNAFVYVASGAGPHPTAILLHGFPGNERNLDVAQSMRRAGWDVLYFDYRGSWGSPGDFSFTHCIEDAQAAIAWVKDAANAKQIRGDGKTVVLVGHSMGGFVAYEVGARDPSVTGVVGISAADLGVAQLLAMPEAQRTAALKTLSASLAAEGMAPLTGTTADALAQEVLTNASAWSFVGLAPQFTSRPLLVLTADDGWEPVNDALVAAVQKLGNHAVTTVHYATDHSYSDRRIAIQNDVVMKLGTIGGK
jgi:uncharacterized protein